MASKQALWKFNWIGGGYNQVYACTRQEALEVIEEKFSKCGLKVNPRTLVRVADEKVFWDNYPTFD